MSYVAKNGDFRVLMFTNILLVGLNKSSRQTIENAVNAVQKGKTDYVLFCGGSYTCPTPHIGRTECV